MKFKYANKTVKRCIDTIKNNIENHLKRVYELESDLSSQSKFTTEAYVEKTHSELTCIAESMLWLRRYIPEFDNYTSKDGRCTVKLSFDDLHHPFTTDVKDWSYSGKPPILPLTRSNADVSIKVEMSGFSGNITRLLEYTVNRVIIDDLILSNN